MKNISATLALSALALASGCRTLGPDHKAPAPAMPESFTGAAASPAARPEGSWWALYQDPELDRLIIQALDHNADLGASLAIAAP